MNDKILNSILADSMELYFRRYSNSRWNCGWAVDLEYFLYYHIYDNSGLLLEDYKSDLTKDIFEKIKAIAENTDIWLVYDKGISIVSLITFRKQYIQWKGRLLADINSIRKKRDRMETKKKDTSVTTKKKDKSVTTKKKDKSVTTKKKDKSVTTKKKVTTNTRKCIVCGSKLTGRQKKFCSTKCKKESK